MKPSPTRSGAPAMFRRLLPVIAALACTLVALPIRAVTFPAVPLQSGAAYPPANIMFILDDTGSMAWRYMYTQSPTRISYNGGKASSGPTGDNVGNDSAYTPFGYYSDNRYVADVNDRNAPYTDSMYDRTYVTNGIYYNPGTDYRAWVQADGTRVAGGTTYDSAYVGYSLAGPGQSTENLAGYGTATYFVPKAGVTDLATAVNYYRFRIEASGAIERCDYTLFKKAWGWRNCIAATPTGRSAQAERNNFATWYSYYRTRSKTAKAGAAEAFGQIGSNLRVGFDTVWNRNPYSIPVGTLNGQFSGTNRAAWYARLQSATADGGTPLKAALQRNGEYFKDTSATGPWGPETGSNQLSCRQNFAILTTDGYWNVNSGFKSVGDTDGTAGPTQTSSTGETYTYAVANPYKDNFKTSPSTRGDTLADVAMEYWKNDLVPSLANNVPSSGADPAFWQHMTTFSVSIGQQGTLNPKTDLPSIANGSKRWPDPIPTENATRIDDLWHAAVNGRGSFVVAKNPLEFAQGLVDALATVAARLGSASNVTANSTSFTSDTRVFQASYVSGKWTGELSAYDATQAGISPTPAWQASAQIPTTGRKVLTWSGAAGVSFPTPAQVAALGRTIGLAPVTGTDNASYIQGATTLEKRNGGVLRDRASLLGDIAYSSPIYVKDSETIFVGANDGMLHAFDALTGAERFAYIPGGINLADLSTLSDPQYTHKYFVDGPVVVSTTAQTPGRNYLVGALGRGGKGVFGLDVTTPGSFGTNDVLWESASELSAAQIADMGQVLGEPLVVTLNDGTKAVLVSNGLNSDTRTAALFILDIATGAVIKEINTNVGGLTDENGLFAPRGWDDDGNGTVDFVYAGDFKGNLWKFDLSGATASTWTLALSGQPLFTTKSGQPITAGLGLARDPLTLKRWVFVGTGSFLSTGDTADNTVQSVYGIIDDAASAVTLSDLTKRTIAVLGTVNGKAIRGFEPNTAVDPSKKGWYIDLDAPTPGERVVSNPRVIGTVLIVASIIPPSNDTCDAGGTGYINAIDAFTGTSLSQPFFDANGDGKVDNGDTINADGTAVPVGSIDLGIGMPTLPTIIDKLLVVGGSKGSLGSILVNPQGGATRRVSWREILRD